MMPQPAPLVESTPREIIHDIYCGRDFINKPFCHSDGSIFSKVRVFEYESSVDIDLSLKIRDCDRTITLAFGANTEESFENSLYKVDILIQNLNLFREAIAKARLLKTELDLKKTNPTK
jgi:hypothetical protein